MATLLHIGIEHSKIGLLCDVENGDFYTKMFRGTIEKGFSYFDYRTFQNLNLKISVLGTNAWVCLMALISDFVIGYHVSFM